MSWWARNRLTAPIGGEAIANTANRMIEGTLYSKEELEEMDALVIMQVHDRDVFNSPNLKEKYSDYETPIPARIMPPRLTT